MKVIGLAGRSGVGKNTIADLYFRPYGYLDVSLAEDIKIRAVATGVATYEDVFAGAKPPAVRTWLQQEGTERGRHIYGEDLWARGLFARLRRMEESWGLDAFVITDVRFVSEVQYIRKHGGLVYRVDAPLRNQSNGMSAEQREHSSETELDYCPLGLFNGIILNDPDEADSVRWQIECHLYLAEHVRGRPRAFSADSTRKLALLRKMFPSGVTRASR